MKILYLAPDPVPSPKGASVRIRRTVETYRALGHEVEMFTPAFGQEKEFPHDTVPLPEENFLKRMMTFRREAARWLKGKRADLIQFRGLWEGIPALDWARHRGAPAVFEAHGFPSIELRYHYPGLSPDSGVLQKIILEEQQILGSADRLVTPSRTGARFLLMRGIPQEIISVVPNVVDTELFSPPADVPADDPPFRMVYQGTLSPWQGLSTLLEAMVPFRNRNLVELHVVGPGKSQWRRAVKRQLRQLRIHHFVQLSGAMEHQDLVPVLRTANLCLAPLPADPRNSVQGCCPIKLLEYMGVGRPILSTRIDPVEEILEHGVSAHLVRPGSPHALHQGISWMIEHPEEREALGAAARVEALANWTPDRFRHRIQNVLQSLPSRNLVGSNFP